MGISRKIAKIAIAVAAFVGSYLMTCKHRTRMKDVFKQWLHSVDIACNVYMSIRVSHSDTHSRVFTRSRRAVYLRFLRVSDRHDIENIVSQNYITQIARIFQFSSNTSWYSFVYNNGMRNNDWKYVRYSMTFFSGLRAP